MKIWRKKWNLKIRKLLLYFFRHELQMKKNIEIVKMNQTEMFGFLESHIRSTNALQTKGFADVCNKSKRVLKGLNKTLKKYKQVDVGERITIKIRRGICHQNFCFFKLNITSKFLLADAILYLTPFIKEFDKLSQP